MGRLPWREDGSAFFTDACTGVFFSWPSLESPSLDPLLKSSSLDPLWNLLYSILYWSLLVWVSLSRCYLQLTVSYSVSQLSTQPEQLQWSNLVRVEKRLKLPITCGNSLLYRCSAVTILTVKRRHNIKKSSFSSENARVLGNENPHAVCEWLANGESFLSTFRMCTVPSSSQNVSLRTWRT